MPRYMLPDADAVKSVGNLDLVGIFRERIRGRLHIRCRVRCKECAKDPELFGDGVFTTWYSVYLKGAQSCGCVQPFGWSESQHKVRAARKCKERGFNILAWEPREWRGVKSRLTLQCAKDGHTWEIALGDLLSGRGCPQCKIDTLAKPDEYYITKWQRSGKFPVDIQYTRLPAKWPLTNTSRRWLFHCPTCAADSFAHEDISPGSFETATGTLNGGHVPCRCAPRKGFDSTKPAYVYVLKITGAKCFTGYGISGSLPIRFKAHKKNLADIGCEISECHLHLTSGISALRIEGMLINTFPCANPDVDGFRRESTHSHLYTDVIETLNEFLPQTEPETVAFVQSHLAAISEASKEECCDVLK